METYDFIAIGGGSGGFNAARTARKYMDRVAIVDGAEQLGGLCILRGCMPSKTLIYSAEVLRLAQKGATFGLDIPSATSDMKRLRERKLRIIGEFTQHRVGEMESDDYDLYRSRAKFVSEDTIELEDGRRLQGTRFLIATGSHVATPPIPGLDSEGAWTSDDVLELDFLPESVIMLGGGVVACELTQFLARMGSKVTQIQRSRHILKEYATDISEVAESAFREDGVELFTDTDLQKIEKADEGFRVTFGHEGNTVTRTAPHLVNGLGRVPATRNLGLEAAGVRLKENGQIETDPFQATSNPRVYAAGDCTGPYEIVHLAVLQGELAAYHAAGIDKLPLNYDHMLEVVFTDPQIAVVGHTERALRKKKIPFVAADFPFSDSGKAILMEATRGFVRIFAERPSGKILGAEVVSKDAGELIHALSVAVSHEATAESLLRTHWYHPTLAEILSYPLEDIVDSLA